VYGSAEDAKGDKDAERNRGAEKRRGISVPSVVFALGGWER